MHSIFFKARLFLTVTTVACLISGCEQTTPPLFTSVPGIDFENAIPENDSTNIVLFEYIYNGGGVGVGDFDKDGNPDLVFSGNFVSSKLYLQRESWDFTDVTEAAGLTTNVWCSGVNVSDVDGNGWDDIYFATLNPSGDNDTPNLLFLNQGTNAEGIPTFIEAAAMYGIDDLGYGTHSAWFDYENDGDLDLYVLNNAIENYNRNVAKGTDTTGRGRSVDRVYLDVATDARQDAPSASFKPLSSGEGLGRGFLNTEGWGLGIAVQDFNMDGYADIYVANDFLSNDFLLMNQGGNGFRDELRQRIPHQSRNSMGIDVADVTGDGRPEIMVVDMLPDDNARVKTMFGDVPHQGDRMERQRGYAQQYIRNTLQLNNGDGTFSDVAFQAGVAATDWSWTPLLADFDNDGDRDIFVSNGYPKDITNKDFIDFSEQATQFGNREAQLRKVMDALEKVEGVHQPNYFFRNDGLLEFSRAGWLPNAPTYSNGSVMVDLDRDGDLDLVTNNINEPAGVFRNNLREESPESSHYLLLDLEGSRGNADALGTKIWLTVGDSIQYHEHYRQRGYLSTVDQLVHFGLGKSQRIDRIVIRFPDGRGMEMTDVAADQILRAEWSTALPTSPLGAGAERRAGATAPAAAPQKPTLVTRPVPGGPVHQESLYSDFDTYALALRDHSKNGPAMAAIDLDGDDIDELVFGGAAGQPVTVWKQDGAALTQVQSLASTAQSEAIYIKGGYEKKANYGHVTVFSQKEGPTAKRAVITQRFKGNLDSLTPAQPFFPYGTRRNNMVENILSEESEVIDAAYARNYRNIQVVIGNNPDTIEIPHTAGWYYSLTAVDLDQDGDLDLVAGNVGLNTPYRVSPERPLVVHIDDYDNNGTVDPIVTAWNGDQAHPVAPRNTLARQLPGLKRELTSYAAYGAWTDANLPPMSDKGYRLKAVEFRSLYLENDGKGNFTVRPLPALAQTAPLRDALEITLSDGRPALLCVQNDYATEPLGGKFDAGTGFALTLGADGELEVLPNYIQVREDARSIVKLRSKDGDRIFVGVNNGPLLELVPPASAGGY